MGFILSAMAHHGYGFALRQFLQKAQREFLAVVLDGAIAAIDGAAFK